MHQKLFIQKYFTVIIYKKTMKLLTENPENVYILSNK